MTDETKYAEMYVTLTFDEKITKEDHDELLEFIQDDWEPSGHYDAKLFEFHRS